MPNPSCRQHRLLPPSVPAIQLLPLSDRFRRHHCLAVPASGDPKVWLFQVKQSSVYIFVWFWCLAETLLFLFSLIYRFLL